MKLFEKSTVTAILAVVALILAGAFLVLSIDEVREGPEQHRQAMLTLCAWKDSLRAQIDTAWQFLEEYPEGTEGISHESVAATIEDKECNTGHNLAVSQKLR